jgi:NCS1 family nucleobase:cation symporter-1
LGTSRREECRGSALLGPIGGIMIADYFIYRKRQLDVNDLYQPHARYRYSGGFSGAAIAALVLAVLPNIPGFPFESFPEPQDG